jgi:hypothetical protein
MEAEKLYPLSRVMEVLGIGKTSVYELVRAGKLSKPVRPMLRTVEDKGKSKTKGKNHRCWPASEVHALVRQIIQEQRGVTQ